MNHARTALMALVTIAACKADPPSGTEYKHPSPPFKVRIPKGLEKGKVHPEGDGGNLAFTSKDGSRDVFLLWAKTGSQYDPQNNYASYGKEADHKKTLAEGTLPGDVGKWIEHDRGRIYVHAVGSKDGWGVLCMASSPTDKIDVELLDVCKALSFY
jgi:hypothetical protein